MLAWNSLGRFANRARRKTKRSRPATLPARSLDLPVHRRRSWKHVLWGRIAAVKPIARLATVSARHVASAALVWVVIVVAGALSLLACSTLALAATTHDEAVFDHLWARARALKPEV